MELRSFLCSAILWNAVLALSIPRHGVQRPLLLERPQHQAQSHATAVMLGFTQSGSDEEHRFEIPLRTLISAGVDLPRHPNTMKIGGVVNDQRQSAPLEELDRIICRVVPKISVEERAVAEQRAWPWFTAEDGAVQFESSSSRWFLAGRSIQSYECR